MKNPAGEVVIDETSTSEAPPNTLNFVICESTASDIAEEVVAGASISLFPNPVSSTSQLQGFRVDEAWEVQVFSLLGKLVHSQSGVGNGLLNATDLPSGLYTVLVRFSGTQQKLQLIKG